ncbi:MAG: hypothetical protein QXX72_03700 [Desulfurococcaceae archaeon]
MVQLIAKQKHSTGFNQPLEHRSHQLPFNHFSGELTLKLVECSTGEHPHGVI